LPAKPRCRATILTGAVNARGNISAFDKLNRNLFGTFTTGDPRPARLAARIFF
jgi:hypothetical protein